MTRLTKVNNYSYHILSNYVSLTLLIIFLSAKMYLKPLSFLDDSWSLLSESFKVDVTPFAHHN